MRMSCLGSWFSTGWEFGVGVGKGICAWVGGIAGGVGVLGTWSWLLGGMWLRVCGVGKGVLFVVVGVVIVIVMLE